jgi:hypothetical protein
MSLHFLLRAFRRRRVARMLLALDDAAATPER